MKSGLFRAVGGAAVCAALLSGCGSGSGNTLDENGNVVATNLPEIKTSTSAGFVATAGTRVSFIVTDVSGRVAPGDKVLAESECINALIGRGLQVVERAQLDRIVQEQGWRSTGLFNEGEAVRAGKLANAKGSLIVQVAGIDVDKANYVNDSWFKFDETEVRLTIRWIDVETGTVMWNGVASKKTSGIVIFGSGKPDYRKELTSLVEATIAKLPVTK